MTPETASWLGGLRTFLKTDRTRPRHRSTPDPVPAVLAEVERVVADSVRRWASVELPLQMETRRRWISQQSPGDTDRDPAPAILLTTTPHGLDVATRLLADDPHEIVVLLEVEYRRWCRIQPDEAMRHHVTAWNWIKTRLPKARQAEFPGELLEDGEVFWLHRTGIAGIADDECRNSALLAFDGVRSRVISASVIETRFA